MDRYDIASVLLAAIVTLGYLPEAEAQPSKGSIRASVESNAVGKDVSAPIQRDLAFVSSALYAVGKDVS